MKHFINQSNELHVDRINNGGVSSYSSLYSH